MTKRPFLGRFYLQQHLETKNREKGEPTVDGLFDDSS